MATSAIGRLSAILELNSAQFNKGVEQAQRKLKRFSRTAQRTGQNMSRNISLPMAVAAGGAVKAFASFDTAMNESLAIMGDVSEAMRKDMAQAARTTAKEVTFSAKESAESFFFLASAGLDAKASIAALPVVSKFAQAGAFNMARATDLLTDAQSALGLAIKNDAVANMRNMVKVSDVLVKANTLANASVEQFSTALTSKAGAALKSFNIDIEEGVAVLAAFADQGVKAELAGNALDRILRLLPQAATQNAEAFRQFGIEVFDSQGKIRNLGLIIGDLEDALEGMTDEQKFATLETLGFQARVQAIIKPLLGTSDAIREYEKGLRAAGGTTNDVANKQMQAFGKRLGLIRDRIVDVSITIGETLAPTVISIAENVADAAEAFSNLSPAVQRASVAIAAAVAAAGPLLIALGLIASGLTVLTGAGGLIALTFIAFGTLGATLREKTNPAITAAREAEEELQRVLNDTSSSDKAIESAKSNAREKLKLAKAALAAAKAELELSAVQNDALGMDAFIGGTATQRRIIELEQTIKSLSGSLEESSQMFIRLGDNSAMAAGKVKEVGESANQAAGGLDNATDSMSDFQSFTENFETDAQRLEQFRKKLEFLHEQFEAGKISLERYNSEVQSATSGLSDMVKQSDKAAQSTHELSDSFKDALADTEKQLKGAKEASRRWTDIWQGAVNSTSDSIANMFIEETLGEKRARDQAKRIRDERLQDVKDQLQQGTISEKEAREQREEIHKDFAERANEINKDVGDRMKTILVDSFADAVREMISTWLKSGIIELITKKSWSGFSLANVFGFGSNDGSSSSGGGNIITTAANKGIVEAFKSTEVGKSISQWGSSLFSSGATGTAAGGGITTLGGANAGLGGGISGASVTGGAAGAGLGGGAGISGASVTGGSAGAGLGGGAASGGAAGAGVLALAPAVVLAAKEIGEAIGLFHAGSVDRMLGQFRGFQGQGPLGTRVGVGGGNAFVGGPNQGFAGAFAEEQGKAAFTSEAMGITAIKDTGANELIKLLQQAQDEFETLKKSAANTFDLGEQGSMRVGQAIKDGVIQPVEFANLGLIEMGKEITHAETGAKSLGEVGVSEFRKITQAVDQGNIRMAALRGEVMLNQQELDFLSQIGVTAAQALEDVGRRGSAAMREIEGAANAAAGAVASVGGSDFSPKGDPNAGRGLTQQLRNDAQTRRIHGGR